MKNLAGITRVQLAVVLLVSLFAFLGGAMLTSMDSLAQSYVLRVSKKVTALLKGPVKLDGKIIETALLNIKISSVLRVPDSIHPQGGGLGLFGGELFLLTNDGYFYIADGTKVERIALIAPYNGFEEYKSTVKARAAAGKNVNELNIHRLRYNAARVVKNENKSKLLVSFVEWNSTLNCYRNVVAGVELSEQLTSLSALPNQVTWERVYESQPCLPLGDDDADIHGHMSGGKIADIGNSMIVIGNGDFEWDGVSLPVNPDLKSRLPVSQDPRSDYGKVVAINWVSREKKLISSGNRNMQGIAAGSDGTIWSAEHGPRGGDKINNHKLGNNFGWPARTYGTQYNLKPWPNAVPYGRMDGFDTPAFAWVPSVAPSDLVVLEGFDESWNGDLIVGSLKAASIFRVRIENGRGVYAEPIYIGFRIRSVLQYGRSTIVLWTDDNNLVFINVLKAGSGVAKLLEKLDSLPVEKLARSRVSSALDNCLQCHSFEDGNNQSAPTLSGIVGRKIGTTSFSGYSAALKEKNGSWTKSSFVAYVRSPNTFASGSTMPAMSLDDETIGYIYDLLSKNDSLVKY
jgi:aldose sugar dehydrogenase